MIVISMIMFIISSIIIMNIVIIIIIIIDIVMIMIIIIIVIVIIITIIIIMIIISSSSIYIYIYIHIMNKQTIPTHSRRPCAAGAVPGGLRSSKELGVEYYFSPREESFTIPLPTLLFPLL